MMPTDHPRLNRERSTLAAMIRVYCHANHHPAADLCPECADLQEYAFARLSRCPFQPDKPTCANCTVHCYKPEMRARVRGVMRFAGPHMIYRHPWLAIMHIVDGFRKAKTLKRSESQS